MENFHLKRIHVNQHRIKSNHKSGDREPVITVKTSKSNTYGNRVDILDENNEVIASVLYRPDKPLSCGARVWIETNNKLQIVN